MVLWVLTGLQSNIDMSFSLANTSLLILAALATGAANALWTLAVIKGNVTLLATLSILLR